MRSIFAGVVLFFVCLPCCAPALGQTTPPTFLFLLEGKGVSTGTVHAFRVNSSTGGITEAPGSPFNAGLVPNQLVADPAGRFLFVTNEESQDITGFSVDAAAGTLLPLTGSPTYVGAQPVTAAIDPTGRFLYVFALTNINANTLEMLYTYAIDPVTGFLTLTNSSPSTWESAQGVLISSITFNAAGDLAYLGQVAGGTMGAPTLICVVDFASGALSVVNSVQVADQGAANAIVVSPSGSALYSINSTGDLIDVFTLGSAGSRLTENPGSPYKVAHAPASISVHPSGNFLYLASENQSYQTTLVPTQYTGSVSAYAINSSSGSLTPVAGSPFVAGINPVSVVVDPTGTFAYSASTKYTAGYTGFAQILGYTINPSTGALTPFPSPAFSDVANSNGGQLVIVSGAVTPNPVPTISSLNPTSIAATGVPFTLQVNGVNFVPGATVYFRGHVRSTNFVSPTQLNASILATDIDDGGNVSVLVFDPLPGGGPSAPVIFPVNVLVPVITSTNPTTVVAGPYAFGFFCSGSNFTTSSVINFNGSPILTLYFGGNEIFGIAPAGDVTNPGTITVTVTTASSSSVPGGGTSNVATIPITPAIIPISVTSILPSNATAGGPPFILTVLGNGFVQGSQVTFNLQSVPTTFVNPTELTATVPGSSIAVAGNPYVIVTNPGGSASSAITFAVNNPPPATGAITPQIIPAGSNTLTLNVTGTSFAPNSVVLVNGGMRPTTYRSSSQVSATLLPGDLQQGSILNIAVSNPPPGGGTTVPLPLTVYEYKMVAANANQTVTAGSQANFSLTVSAVNGTFSHSLTLSASGLPSGATASFSPASIPAGSATTIVILSVTTAARALSFRRDIPFSGESRRFTAEPILLLVGSVCIWFLKAEGRARRAVRILFGVLVLSAALSLVSCASVVESPPAQPNSYLEPPGVYPIIIVGTSDKITINTQVTLTIMQ